MNRLLRRALLAGAGLCLTATAHAQAQAQAQAQPAAPSMDQRDRVWAQSYSDLPADPSIRFGTLPNGMRYAIRHNATPSHQVSLRLRIGSGSLEENDSEQGLAHVLEHMAFNGSTHVPRGEMIKSLERLGLSFGADTNASTGFTETVYQFDLPEADPTTVGTGLMLMREIAGELTLAPEALQSERGVVLSEERLRDTPDFEAMKRDLDFEFKDQLVSHRLPIGLVDIIKNAPASLIRTFYRANYRPDRATLVVVGDIDPAAMEAEIRTRFAGWAPVGPETPTPDYGNPIPRGVATQLVVRPGVTPSMSVNWMAPYDATPDTVARERRDLVERIALMVLNRRLQRLAHGDNPPFLDAGVYRQNFERSGKPATLQVQFRPEGWNTALEAAVETQRQALAFGVQQDEVDREVTEYRVQLRNAAAGAGTRRTPDIANEIVRTVDEQEVDTAPNLDLALFERDVKGLTAAEVSGALNHAFTGSGPLLSVIMPTPVDGGDQAVAAAFAKAESAPVSPPTSRKALAWTHTDFGPAGRVVEQTTVPDLGVTFVRFANGVRLTIKPTDFRKDQTLVAVRFNHGRLAMPTDRRIATWAANGFVQGGLDDLTFEDMAQVLASKTVSVALGLEDESFTLGGTTRPQDLGVQLQLLAAYMTAPGWRPEAFERLRSEAAVVLQTMGATPEGVEGRNLAQLEHSGDLRWHTPTPEEVASDPVAPFKALMQHAMASGPLEVEIVGDVSTPEAIAAVARTFGALPARAEDPVAPGEREVRFPAPTPQPVVRTHTGRGDQAIGYIAWPTTDLFTDPQLARGVNITAAVLDSRLIDQIRIAEGATYSPVVQAEPSETFPGYGFAYASVETPPTKLPGFYADIAKITADMATRGISADELTRAKAPRIEALTKAQQTNEYWLARLQGAQTDPRRLAIIRETIPGYQRITADEVRHIATTYFLEPRAWRFEVEPVNPSPVAAPGAVALPVPQPGAAPPRLPHPVTPSRSPMSPIPTRRVPGAPPASGASSPPPAASPSGG